MDHLFQLGGGVGPPELTRIEGPMLEGYSTIRISRPQQQGSSSV
jgi:hypothetical protein